MSPSSARAAFGPTPMLLLGGLVACAVAGVVMLPLGDPLARAEAAIAREADAVAEGVRLRWERLRHAEELPGEIVEQRFEFGPEQRLHLAPPSVQDEEEPNPGEQRVFDLLVESGLAAERAGDLEGASDAFATALSHHANATARAVAQLHALRVAMARGESAQAGAIRGALRDTVDVDVAFEGTSVRLLAELVPPIDSSAAFALVRDPATVLPAPRDRIDESLGFVPDPWWASVRGRVAGEDDRDAFQVDARHRRALEQVLAPSSSGAVWTFERVGPTLVAQREFEQSWVVTRLREEAIVAALASEPRETPLANARVAPASSFTDAEPLAGIDLAFAVERADPRVVAKPELLRLRLLRGGLFALSLLVAAATVAIARAMRRAARLAELRSTFVASVSHDLRTPTQAILLLAETLEDGRVATGQGRAKYHTRIRREAQRLRRMVEDLLDGARIDRGGGSRIAPREVDTAAFLDELKATMRERADECGAMLVVEREALPASLHVDPDGIHRAVWNLFENALKHGARGGDPVRVRVAFGYDEDALQVTVDDDGPGIPARYLETVFEPFERLRDRSAAGTIADDTGTGLGLAIVRAIARAHGGDAAAMPSEQGARFTVTFRQPDGEEEAA